MAWKQIKKTIYTLNVDNYAPEITELTYPYIKKYSHKIGADFHIINERKFPDFPVTYEKLQIYELGKSSDWNIYIDSDTLIHPDTPDVTVLVPKDTILHNGADFAPIRWRYDNCFLRDGRHIGSCNWFTVASDWCLDLWHPLEDISLQEALDNIFPTTDELNTVITKEHLIDDYVLSRNIARYGLKANTISQIWQTIGEPGDFFWHQYQIPISEKVIQMKEIINLWGKTHSQIQKEKGEFWQIPKNG